MIIYDGIKFYPTAQGYYLGTVDGRPKRLHRYVWEKHNGAIPEGYHIHHKDGDKSNNDLSNLVMTPGAFHLSAHSERLVHTEEAKARFRKAQAAATKWHKSDAAKETHREIYEHGAKAVWMAPVTLVCQYCGKEYRTVYAKRFASKYCSSECKEKANNLKRHPRITKVCENCGKEFTTGDERHRFCSKECRQYWHNHHKK